MNSLFIDYRIQESHSLCKDVMMLCSHLPEGRMEKQSMRRVCGFQDVSGLFPTSADVNVNDDEQTAVCDPLLQASPPDSVLFCLQKASHHATR